MESTLVFALLVGAAVVAVLLTVLYTLVLKNSVAPRRTAVLLMGLPGSGKTALFAQLTSGKEVSSCTSMEVNEGRLCLSGKEGKQGVDESSPLIIDHPGHRRLYHSLRRTLQRAIKVILVVDAVSVQDDRHEGAAAVAELLYTFLHTPEFYGVRQILVACTKRDELTSYSAKAVKKMLEAALTSCIQSRRGELSQVDEVLDASGAVAGKRHGGKGAGGGRRYMLDVDDNATFRFEEHLPVDVRFADISSMTQSLPSSGYNTDAVRQFILE